MTADGKDTTTNETRFGEIELPTVAALLGAARLELAGEQYIPRGVATDWLLDLLNAAVRPSVKRVILLTLEDFCHRNMSPAAEFFEALDRVQIALQVDAAYDDFELEAV